MSSRTPNIRKVGQRRGSQPGRRPEDCRKFLPPQAGAGQRRLLSGRFRTRHQGRVTWLVPVACLAAILLTVARRRARQHVGPAGQSPSVTVGRRTRPVVAAVPVQESVTWPRLPPLPGCRQGQGGRGTPRADHRPARTSPGIGRVGGAPHPSIPGLGRSGQG